MARFFLHYGPEPSTEDDLQLTSEFERLLWDGKAFPCSSEKSLGRVRKRALREAGTLLSAVGE